MCIRDSHIAKQNIDILCSLLCRFDVVFCLWNRFFLCASLRLLPVPLVPVSYTHLDVYKRQGLPCTISLGGGDFAVLADEFLHFLCRTLMLNRVDAVLLEVLQRTGKELFL